MCKSITVPERHWDVHSFIEASLGSKQSEKKTLLRLMHETFLFYPGCCNVYV